jgi:hypothetical protein
VKVTGYVNAALDGDDAVAALVHLRGFGAALRPLPSSPFGRPATRQPWPSAPAPVAPMT